ncbi:hypothetical protein QQ045_022888 [Rhodiola kirilowii]
MSDMSDYSGEVYMSTLVTLDNPIRDEYNRDAMENLDNVADENLDAEVVQDRIVWDHPTFNDISAWEIYRPSDENRYSILNRVEFRVRKSNNKKLVLECRKGEEICPWRLRVVVMARTTYWTVRKNRGDHALQDSSPNNFVKWDVTPLDDGQLIFWAFSECILAFKHCRPILSIDGTHMYGKYNAKLLIAIGLDANNHILPLAFTLVESENTSSWKWFMSCIREGVTQREGLCVVSDGHAGILATMREPEWRDPKAYHRVCVRHLQSNFMTKVKDEGLKAKLGDVAYAKKELKFRKKFGELLELFHDKPLARKWLVDMNVELWIHAFDHGRFRCGNMTTNASECLNKILKNGRDLPVSSLVMYTFKQTAAYFIKHSQSPYNNEGELFPPKIRERLAELRARDEFHIVTLYNPVDPCRFTRVDYTDYVPIEYTLEAYYRIWGYFFNPLYHEECWRDFEGPVFVPNPRFKRNKAGRPPTRRRRNELDQRHQHLGESSI